MAGRGQGGRVHVEIEGRTLVLSNLDKVLYPEAGLTKGDVVDYYRRIAPVILPHLAGRPPTLVRAPDGPAGPRFFEKNCPGHHPQWVQTSPGYEATGGTKGCLVDDLPTLVWLANLAALELHTHQWTMDDPEHPKALVFDLDPGEPAGIADCCRVALELRDMLDHFDLVCVAKTSGGKGIHLSVPLLGSPATDDETKRFALGLGQVLEARDKQHVTVDMAKERRHGKVFVDWSQNDRHKTTVCAYSLRNRAQGTVSTPLSWDEVADVAGRGHGVDAEEALALGPRDVVDRVEEHGDIYADALTLHQQLPDL
jgi:bifunctional non-homologous end joining protein LigD